MPLQAFMQRTQGVEAKQIYKHLRIGRLYAFALFAEGSADTRIALHYDTVATCLEYFTTFNWKNLTAMDNII